MITETTALSLYCSSYSVYVVYKRGLALRVQLMPMTNLPLISRSWVLPSARGIRNPEIIVILVNTSF